jgi:hypothetical protein
VPWTAVLAHSSDLECPGCHAELELSRFTSVFGAACGLAGAFIAVHFGDVWLAGAQWVMRVVAAVVGYAVVSAAGVLLAADLAVRPKSSVLSFPHPEK